MQLTVIFFITLFLYGCGSTSVPATQTQQESDNNSHAIFIPKPFTTFSIVLDTDIPKTFSAAVIELDAFETTNEQITALHAQGKKVFAYISVGSWESYRFDSKTFEKDLIGKVYPGWEDEKFLNIKALDKLAPHIRRRFDMIKERGFDGLEADNIDSYSVDEDGKNGTGFKISLTDTKEYIDFLIKEAHKRGLSIGQKNAPELIETYGDLFDWALLEDPFYEDYADIFKIYTNHNKAVFSLSYLDNTSEKYFIESVCPAAKKLHFTALLKDRNLTGIEITCPK
jgi:endo-alpha-1,4-polygalactosaminidase (GH114 family)